MSKRLVVVIGAGLAMVASAAAIAADSSLTVTGAVGEFENRVDTSRATMELRVGVTGATYAVLRAEANEHPRHEVENRVIVGGGYAWRDWNFEAVADDDRYRASVIFTAPVEVWEIKGGAYHGNKLSQGFKQTGLIVSVGYPVLPDLTVGGFYEIGNTTMTGVDDLYGGYATWSF
ncbi:hypothetical protein ACT3R7_11740 [Halomonas sp. AOP43-A1-21]